MLSASLYIIICTARNRLRMRLRRLREPRYLIGAIAGAAYFYFAVFRRMGRGGRRGGSSFSPSAMLASTGRPLPEWRLCSPRSPAVLAEWTAGVPKPRPSARTG
jgi:hypothetical protein